MTNSLFVPTIILLVALITDIREHKIYNKWVLISIALALFSSYYLFGFEGLKQGATAAGLALAMTLPLVLLGALGAGDMKLMFAFGLASTYSAVFSVIIFSFIWAAIVGLIFAFYQGSGIKLLKNTFKLLTAQARDESEFQKIPYTIALVLGWITFLFLGFKQGAFI